MPEPGTPAEPPAGPGAPPNRFGFDSAARHEPAEQAPPVARAADLEAAELAEAPLEQEPPEWTASAAAALLRGVGYVGHVADPLHRAEHPEAAELWKWTEADAIAAGEPLARMLNRYGPLRALAGVADEAELAFTLTPYVLMNLSRRGRIIAATRGLEEQPAGPFEGAVPAPPPPPPDVVLLPTEPPTG